MTVLVRYGGLALLLIVTQQFLVHQYESRLANLILIYAIAAIGVNISLGYAGLISMAHAALMAVGAYTSVIAMQSLGAPFGIALITAMVASAFLSGLIGILGTRAKPLYFLVITLGLHQVVSIIILNETWLTGGAIGIPNVPAPRFGPWDFSQDREIYSLLAALMLGSLYVADRLRQSKEGRAMVASATNESAARLSGIYVSKYRVLGMVVSGAYLGLAGSLFAHLIGFLAIDSFGLALMLQLFLMVVLGGLGSNFGAIAGAALLTVTTDQLRGTGGGWVLYYGIGIMILVIVAPRGLAGLGSAARAHVALWFHEPDQPSEPKAKVTVEE